MDKKTMERLIKFMITQNQGLGEFSKDFLKLYDNFALSFEDNGDSIKIETKYIGSRK